MVTRRSTYGRGVRHLRLGDKEMNSRISMHVRRREPEFRRSKDHDFRSPKGSGRKNSEKRPHIKAAARGATVVSIVRGWRRFRNSAGRQQVVDWAPVSRKPICGGEI